MSRWVLFRTVAFAFGLGLFASNGFAQEAFDEEAFGESEDARLQDYEEGFVAAHEKLLAGKNKAAVRSFKALAAKGHAKSQHMLGVCYRNGLGVGKNAKRAAYWFREAAQREYPFSMLVFGELSFSGDGVPQDYAVARNYLEPLAALNWAFAVPLGDFALERSVRSRAAYLTGILYVEGLGTEKDAGKALELLRFSSKTGDASASMFLAMTYAKGELVERSLEESKRYFELSDLQSFDGVRRALEASMLENADEATRADFEKTAKELSESFTQNLFRAQTNYAKEILDEKSEAYAPEFARALLKMAAESGYKEAQYLLGWTLCQGVGGQADFEEGFSWLEKASEQGWTMADYSLAVLLSKGLGCEVDPERARKLFDKSAEQGLYTAQLVLDGDRPAELVSDEADLALCRSRERDDARALYALTRRRELGWLMEAEPRSKKALKAYQKGAEAGYARAQHAYAEYYYWANLGERDYKKAREYFQRAGDQGHAQSYFKIGYIYEKALDVEADFEKAADYYKMSSDFGDSWAANNLGAIYNDGKLGEKDYGKAMEFYRLAEERGNPVACFNIASAYLYGRGVEIDKAAAVEWYGKAAELGDLDAAQKLLKLYRGGEVEGDISDLAYWAEKAAELGDLREMVAIAQCYFAGNGVPKSPLKSAIWLSQYLNTSSQYHFLRPIAQLLFVDLLLEEGWSGHDVDQAFKLCSNLASALSGESQYRAQFRLADLHLDGATASSYPTRGVALLRKVYKSAAKEEATRQDAAEAAYRVSLCYRKGLGVKADDTKRAEWMKKAADLGLLRARYFYARFQVEAMGMEQNLSAGIQTLEQLSDEGLKLATVKLGELVAGGVVAREGREELMSRLVFLAEKGEKRAAGVLRELGVEFQDPLGAEPAEPAVDPDTIPKPSFGPAVIG